MINKFLRATLAAILTISMVSAPFTTAKAEELDTPEDPVLIDEYGTNYLVTMCAGEINANVDTLTCEVTSFTPQCTVFASVANNDVNPNASVDCYLIFPNGTSVGLGLVPATGGQSFTRNFAYLMPGEYTFYFVASVTDPLEVAGFIYV